MSYVYDEESKSGKETWISNPAVTHRGNDSKYSICNDEEDCIDAAEIIFDDPITTVKSVKSEEEVRTSRIFINRAIVCLLAVSLLWMTSLQVALGIMDAYVSAPSMNSVISGCEHSYNTISDQRNSFGVCVARQLTDCNAELTTAYLDEKSRVSAYETANTGTLLALQRRQSNCSTALANAEASMNAWTNQGLGYSIPYKACPAVTLADVKSMLGEVSTASSADVYSTSTSYTASSDSTVSHLASYVDALSSYNYQYVNNKTKALRLLSINIVDTVSLPQIKGINASFASLEAQFDQMISCLTLSNRTALSCPLDTSMRQEYESLRRIVNQDIVQAQKYGVQVQALLLQVRKNVAAATAKANSFYESVLGAQGVITWISQNLGVTTDQLCGHSSFCQFSEMDWYVTVPYMGNIPYMQVMPFGNDLWDQIKVVVPAERAKIVATAAAVGSQAKAWLKSMENSLNIGPFVTTDYHPPKYQYAANTSVESKKQNSRSAIFKASLATQLDALSKGTIATTVTEDFKKVNTSAPVTFSGLSSFHLSWEKVNLSGIRFASWLATLTTLRGLLCLFDYLYRGIHTMRLIQKFVGRSAVTLPFLDLRLRRGEEGSSECWIYFQQALELLPYVYVQLLMIAFFIGFSCYIVGALFVPEYYSYAGGCVHNTANETFLSAKVFSIGFNYAAGDGNAQLSAGMQDYNSKSAQYCSNSQMASVNSYNSFMQSVSNNNQTFQSEVSNLGMLSSCVNITAFNTLFNAACCSSYSAAGYFNLQSKGGVALKAECAKYPRVSANKCPRDVLGQVYLPPGDYISDPTCDPAEMKEETVYLDSKFDCAALPVCEVSCGGPDVAVVKSVCKSCSCMTEWLLNSYVFQIALAICVYLILNISRWLVVKGVVMVVWRSLTREEFEVKTACSRAGNIIFTPPPGVVRGERISRRGKDEYNEGGCDNKRVEEEEEGVCSVAEDERARSSAVRAGIERMLSRFVFRGYIYVALGLLLNAGWLIAVSLVQHNIAYKPV